MYICYVVCTHILSTFIDIIEYIYIRLTSVFSLSGRLYTSSYLSSLFRCLCVSHGLVLITSHLTPGSQVLLPAARTPAAGGCSRCGALRLASMARFFPSGSLFWRRCGRVIYSRCPSSVTALSCAATVRKGTLAVDRRVMLTIHLIFTSV